MKSARGGEIVRHLQVLPDFIVAARAAIARAGHLADVFDRPQAERLDHRDDFVFRHLQATTNDPSGARSAAIHRAG